MPRYKYSCGACKLTDVKQLKYVFEGIIKRPICGFCDGKLERSFLTPPKNWNRRTNV
tara:strand:- start:121 stop:291 length:171 start_codon:yes stop_codon:yes gene_type:complete